MQLVCIRELRGAESICPSCPRRKNSYFVELPFLEQLKEMYKRDGFYDDLQHRFQHPINEGNIKEIYDSDLYMKWMKNGFLLNRDNISFSWYTDGVPVYKSSNISMWLLYLSINELPFEQRKKNTLLLGLWYGDRKSLMFRFVHNFYLQFEKLKNGINVYIPQDNVFRKIRGIVLMGTCDLPAKSDCINLVQFNGNYGCTSCLSKGVNITLEPRSSEHVHPYSNEIVMRTSEESIRQANAATPHQPIMGIKGPSAFSKLMPDFIGGIAIDRMHSLMVEL